MDRRRAARPARGLRRGVAPFRPTFVVLFALILGGGSFASDWLRAESKVACACSEQIGEGCGCGTGGCCSQAKTSCCGGERSRPEGPIAKNRCSCSDGKHSLLASAKLPALVAPHTGKDERRKRPSGSSWEGWIGLASQWRSEPAAPPPRDAARA